MHILFSEVTRMVSGLRKAGGGKRRSPKKPERAKKAPPEREKKTMKPGNTLRTLYTRMIWLKALHSSDLMDAKWYSGRYGVPRCFAAAHYMLIGMWKGNDPSDRFSESSYKDANPDVRASLFPGLAHYELFGRQEGRNLRKTQESSSRSLCCPESVFEPRLSPDELVSAALSYDYVSFDIFDTLLLRNTYLPTDLFRIMEMDLNEPAFAKNRIEAEKECYRQFGVSTNIDTIYAQLSQWMSLDRQKAVDLEFSYEKMVCQENPYMKAVFNKIKQAGKPIILVSDMYWPASRLTELLKSKGYDGWEKMFVSCECGCSKGDGTLQKLAWKKIGREHSVFHIGDHFDADVSASKKIGWNAHWYQSCRDKATFLPDNSFYTVPGSLWRGICCAHLDNGLTAYSKEYEHGFLYGGLLSCGFCDYVRQIADSMHADSIWFLARDMDIVYRLFRMLYPETESKYVCISRAAMLQLNLKHYPEIFFDFYFHTYMQKGTLKIGQVLSEISLEALEDYLAEQGLDSGHTFNASNYDAMRRVFFSHIDAVCASFSDAEKGAELYFKSLAGESRRICVVDLGWNGTIMMELSRFFRYHDFENVALEYVMLGASNAQPATDLQSAGKMHAYVFSGLHDSALQIDNSTWEGNVKIMCLESLFSSDAPTLASYGLNSDGEPCFHFGVKTEQSLQINDIQRGILDFVRLYRNATKDFAVSPAIFPIDAFAPYRSIVDDLAYQYLLFGQTKENEDGMPASGDQSRVTTIGEIMKNRKLI